MKVNKTGLVFLTLVIAYIAIAYYSVSKYEAQPTNTQLQQSIEQTNKQIKDLRAENDKLHEKLHEAGLEPGPTSDAGPGSNSSDANQSGIGSVNSSGGQTAGPVAQSSPQAQSSPTPAASSSQPQQSQPSGGVTPLIERILTLPGL